MQISLVLQRFNHSEAQSALDGRAEKITDARGEGRESDVSPSGEEYVIAEVKFCISRSSLVSAVNHKAARTLREKKTKKQESFFTLNFNVYINLENNFVGRKT